MEKLHRHLALARQSPMRRQEMVMTEGDRLVLHELVRRLSVPEDCKVVAGANLRAQGGLVAALVERGDAVSDRVYKRRRGQQRRLQIAP